LPHCFAAFSIAAIMPQAIGSGKPQPDAAVVRALGISHVFRKAE
jgi:hypothetical protein